MAEQIVTHTPGPWLASNRTSKTHNHPERHWERHVHTSLDLVLIGTASGATQDECEVNARLIAAAPDLLEAAKHAAMEWRLHGQLTDSCRVLEAAIAKAEGR